MTLLCLVGVLLAALVMVLTPDFELARRGGTPFLLLLTFWICVAVTPYRGAKRLMKTSVYLSSPISYIFSSQGIHSTGTHISSDVSYEAVWNVRETKTLFLLYLNASSALVLPKRFFTDAIQQNDWRLFLEQRISPKRIMQSGFLARWC
jgi:hypothetical protein